MKIKTVFLMIIVATQIASCGQKPNDFEMKVTQVDELQGFILKGISISGSIEIGCIANDDEFVVTRNEQEVLRTTTRILNIKDLKDPDSFNGEANKGDYVTLYIPDGKKLDIQPGDILSSNTTSCGKELPKA